MPRTWGPFETIDPASLNEMFDQVELAFARDKQSLGLLESRLSVINRRKLFFAPDYTHEVLPVNVRHGEPSEIAYLIPSRRVIDSGTLSRSRYLQLFELARVHLLSRGIRAKILIHEVEGDMAFIPEFREMGIPDSDIVVPPDALSAKALISEASLIVTSRLHGLYNALNCEIPVAVIAWSFKYKEALDQYGCSECLVDISRPEESLGDILDMLTTPERADALRTQMAEGKLKSGSASEAMWRRIHALAENVTPAELR
jgi:polysaccharide pyruvyl transferase WcaK-like protein